MCRRIILTTKNYANNIVIIHYKSWHQTLLGHSFRGCGAMAQGPLNEIAGYNASITMHRRDRTPCIRDNNNNNNSE